MSVVGSAFEQELGRLRAVPARRQRTALLTLLGIWLARLVVGLPRMRTAALAVGGFGCLVVAAWMVAAPAGWAAAGLSFLILEWLSGEDGRRR